MRILGLGLLAIVLTGTALTLSGYDLVQAGRHALGDATMKTRLVFEPDAATLELATGTEVTFQRANAAAPLILSGLPAYGSARFGLPRTARPQAGYLQIDTTMQVLQGVEGLLRLSIDNTRRGEMLLVPGLVARSLQVPLTAEELSRDTLNVSFSLLGDGPAASCTSQDHLAAVVEIEASSGLVLTLDAPLDSTADRITAWGNDVRVGWPQTLDPDARAGRLALASALLRQGAAVSFHPRDALDSAALRALLEQPGQTFAQKDDALQFPVALTDTASNAGTRTFKQGTTWRTRYLLDESQRAEIPGRLDLGLRLGPLPAEAQWTVSAILNGRLLMARTLAPGARDFTSELVLPLDVQDRNNLLEISAASTQNLPGACNEGPDLIAELTETSVLQGSGQLLAGPLTALRTALQAKAELAISATPDLSAADALAHARMIATVVPASVTLRGTDAEADTGSDTGAQITPLDRADVAALPTSGRANAQSWIVYADTDEAALQVVRGTRAALDSLATRAPLALLIQLTPLRSAELAR